MRCDAVCIYIALWKCLKWFNCVWSEPPSRPLEEGAEHTCTKHHLYLGVYCEMFVIQTSFRQGAKRSCSSINAEVDLCIETAIRSDSGLQELEVVTFSSGWWLVVWSYVKGTLDITTVFGRLIVFEVHISGISLQMSQVSVGVLSCCLCRILRHQRIGDLAPWTSCPCSYLQPRRTVEISIWLNCVWMGQAYCCM